MAHPLPLVLLAIAAPIVGGIGAPLPEPDAGFTGQVTIHERIIIRIPKLAPAPVPAPGRQRLPARTEWKEKKGPRCIGATDLAGALISQPGSVDLVLTDGAHIRAVLDDDCGPLDYYRGYYIRPADDGQICAKRDMIRVRSGGSCTIARFRRLVAR